jgi:hypothetical protein
MVSTDWTKVSNFFNGVIEEATDPTLTEEETQLEVAVYSPNRDETLTVVIPTRKVDDFMKNLTLYEAFVENGDWRIE